jgi:hypothetical protein
VLLGDEFDVRAGRGALRGGQAQKSDYEQGSDKSGYHIPLHHYLLEPKSPSGDSTPEAIRRFPASAP